MAIRIRVYADYDYVGVGMGGAAVYNAAANNPGLGSVGNAQTLRLAVMQPVTAVNPQSPTQTELQTATTAAATQLNALLTTAIVSQIDNWAIGDP